MNSSYRWTVSDKKTRKPYRFSGFKLFWDLPGLFFGGDGESRTQSYDFTSRQILTNMGFMFWLRK